MPNGLILIYGTTEQTSGDTLTAKGYMVEFSIDISDIPLTTFAMAKGNLDNLSFPIYLSADVDVMWDLKYLAGYLFTDNPNSTWTVKYFAIGY